MGTRNRHTAGASSAVPGGHVDRIFGIHAVAAALANPERKIIALHGTRNGLERLRADHDPLPVTANEISPAALSKRLGAETVHQGVMVEAAPLREIDLATAIEHAHAGRPLVVLDQVTDPHNAGAILRSAAAFNAGAVVMTRRNSPPLDGVMAKAASGAIEHVPVLKITNLARVLTELGNAGVSRIGLDGDAPLALETADVRHPCALVLGAEQKGLRRLTAENCDLLCRLTTPGPLKSLNVSNAAAVALHTLVIRTR